MPNNDNVHEKLENGNMYKSGYTVMIFEDLERDVMRFLENVALEYYPDSEDREKIYSPKLSNILINIGSRTDEFFKNWSIVIEGVVNIFKSKNPNISEKELKEKLKRIDIEYYKDIERNKKFILSDIEIFIPRIERPIKPFEDWIDWNNKENPCKSWWCAYNNVKHHGYERRSEGNLDNVIKSLGALFILNCLHKDTWTRLIEYGYMSKDMYNVNLQGYFDIREKDDGSYLHKLISTKSRLFRLYYELEYKL